MNTKLKVLISYDGTDFNGWQIQKGDQPTIQGELERAFSFIFNEPIKITGSGRTDAGVHANGQIAHLVTSKNVQNYQLRKAINSKLPPSIVVKNIWIAPEEFHALHSASHKTYKYWILNREFSSPMKHRFTTWISQELDLNYLQRCSNYLIGEQDFKSFQNTGTQISSTVRKIISCRWERKGTDLLMFSITGTGFLKQMVRNIVGTLIELQLTKRKPEDIVEILKAKDRSLALKTAPPQGLYLNKVYYPPELDIKCRNL